MKHNFWDERYAQEEYVYGETPNVFLEETLPSIPVGKLLLPAEGEGRNAAFVAQLGWDTYVFDSSSVGREKALSLASKNNVTIDYTVSNVEDVDYKEESFDAMALIYAHFPGDKRRAYHRKLASYLKKGGTLIIEGFSKQHAEYQKISPKAGGPKDVDMLYDLEEIKTDFQDFDFQTALETEVELKEGRNHVGASSVVRIIATKK